MLVIKFCVGNVYKRIYLLFWKLSLLIVYTIPFLLFLRSILFLLESTKFNNQVENNETLNETTKKKENKANSSIRMEILFWN